MKKNSVKRILEWFDIARYDEYTRGLSYAEWIPVLWERCEFWGYDCHAQSELFPDLWGDRARELATKSRGDKKKRFDSFIDEMKKGALLNPEWLQEKVDDYDCYASVHKMEESDVMDLVAIYKMDREYDEYTNGLRVYIDLNTEDKYIMQQLKIIIANERKAKKLAPFRSLNDVMIDKMVNLRLLQYLDVILFSKKEQLDINHVALAKVLYPDEYDVNPIERIRKTMPELSASIMTPGFLNASGSRLADY